MLKDMQNGDPVDLEVMNVILKIPKEAVSLEITARIFDEDGTLREVETKLKVSEIMEARQDFLDNVVGGDEYDARYFATEAGREYLKSLDGDDLDGEDEEDWSDGIGQAFSPD